VSQLGASSCAMQAECVYPIGQTYMSTGTFTFPIRHRESLSFSLGSPQPHSCQRNAMATGRCGGEFAL
jgi:hypothetical protein